jgi:hypothetical protein
MIGHLVKRAHIEQRNIDLADFTEFCEQQVLRFERDLWPVDVWEGFDYDGIKRLTRNVPYLPPDQFDLEVRK